MSNESSNEKEHQATGKRLADLRKQGTVLRSKDLGGGIILIVAVIQMVSLSSRFVEIMRKNLNYSLDGIAHVAGHQDILGVVLLAIAKNSLLFLLPIFLVAFIVSWLTPFVFGGWNFTLEAIGFKAERLNPLTNLKNIFSPKRAATEVFKSMMKASIIIGALLYFVFTEKNQILLLTTHSMLSAIQLGMSILVNFLALLCFSLILLMILDIAIQHFQYQSQNKMSTQEVKDEHKEMDGSAETKRRIRSKQMAMAKQRLSASVPKANVIITNPTHYAIALRYDENKDRAPKVLAKGKGLIAQQIRYLAVTHGIPIYEAPVLARAIYHTTKTGLEIKQELYMAVAIVLSYVHQLKNYQMGKGVAPNYVSDLKIPEEFIYSE